MRGDLARHSAELARIVEIARGSVVTVQAGLSLGAGVMVAPHRVVTCWHVLRAGGCLTVTAERTTSEARVLAKDEGNDLALLEVGVLAPVARFGGPVKPGAVVVAIGSPGGRAQFVTGGIVARVGGVVDVIGGSRLLGAVEIDCRVRKGNSGGGLFDVEGRLVAILAAGRAADDTGAGVSVAHVLRLLDAMGMRGQQPRDRLDIDQMRDVFRNAVRRRGA